MRFFCFLPLYLILLGCAGTISYIDRDDKAFNKATDEFVRSLDSLPTSNATEAAKYLQHILVLSNTPPSDSQFYKLNQERGGRIVLNKPIFGSKESNPNAFYIHYFGKFNPNTQQLKDRFTKMLGSPMLEENERAYWLLKKGVLEMDLKEPIEILTFTPFEFRDLFAQIRVPGYITLYPPPYAAKLVAAAVTIAGRPPDTIYHDSEKGWKCIRTRHQDKFAICAKSFDSEKPRHISLSYIGPESAVPTAIPLLVEYGQLIGIATESSVLNSILTAATVKPSIIQRHLEGNLVIQATAHKGASGSFSLLIDLDACDRMGYVDRMLESGHPCYHREEHP